MRSDLMSNPISWSIFTANIPAGGGVSGEAAVLFFPKGGGEEGFHLGLLCRSHRALQVCN